jgi:eukaryotic-like serine/threonine-protein kinase
MYAAPRHDWIVRGRYRVVELVGRGGAGAVYRAMDEQTKESVAVKHLRAISPAAWRRFEIEASLLACVRHPSIAESHGVWVESGKQLMLMRYIPGLDLGAQLALRGRPFRVQRVLEWATHILDALRYLHAGGIVHHDIKPRNIKLDATCRAVLLDFDLATRICRSPVRGPTGYTAAYAPPEQVLGARTDPRSDLYALGATLYELLARRSPPPALERVVARASGQPDPLLPLSAINPTVPDRVAAVVHAAVELDPRNRQPDAGSMRRELLHAFAACQRDMLAEDDWLPARYASNMRFISGHDEDTAIRDGLAERLVLDNVVLDRAEAVH